MRAARVVFFVSLLCIAILAWRVWPSEESRIKRRMAAIAVLMSVPANEPDVARMARILELRDYLAPDLRVRYGGQEATSRETILGALAQWGRGVDAIRVEFVDVQVTIDPADRGVAGVYMTATITGTNTTDAREADVRLARASGDGGRWIVTSAESRETLSK